LHQKRRGAAIDTEALNAALRRRAVFFTCTTPLQCYRACVNFIRHRMASETHANFLAGRQNFRIGDRL